MTTAAARRHDRERERLARSLRGFFHHGNGGRSVRRGNVRLAVLSVLTDGPMHGYQIMTELEDRTGGRWRPSAGSVYPTLQMLEDERLIVGEEVEGRRTFSLTAAGRTAAAEVPAELLESGDREAQLDLRRLAMALMGAAAAVKRSGSPEANVATREILVDARKKIYALLAADDGEADA